MRADASLFPSDLIYRRNKFTQDGQLHLPSLNFVPALRAVAGGAREQNQPYPEAMKKKVLRDLQDPLMTRSRRAQRDSPLPT